MGGQMSTVVHDSDMSIVCHVDMTVSLGARSYDVSITRQYTQTNLNVSCGVNLKLYQDQIHAHIIFLVLTILFQLFMKFRQFLLCFPSFLPTVLGGRWNAPIPWSPPSIQRLDIHSLLQRMLSLYMFSNNMLEYLSNTLIIKLYSWPYLFAVQFCFVEKCSSPWNHSIFY